MSKGFLDQRVNDLEREVSALRSELARALDRQARIGDLFRGIMAVELTEDVADGESASCKLLDWDGTDPTDSGKTGDVWRWGAFTGASGEQTLSFFNNIRRRWEFLFPVLGISAGLAVLDADLAYSGTALATIWRGACNEEAATSEQITLCGWAVPDSQKIPSGAKIIWLKIDGVYYVIVSNECPIDV